MDGKIMGKYWKATMTPDYSRPFPKWHPATSAPRDGSSFMGRLTGTNRAKAVRYDEAGVQFVGTYDGKPVDICQWYSFKEYGETRFCVWNGGKDC